MGDAAQSAKPRASTSVSPLTLYVLEQSTPGLCQRFLSKSQKEHQGFGTVKDAIDEPPKSFFETS